MLFVLIMLTVYSELTQSTYRRIAFSWLCVCPMLSSPEESAACCWWCGGLNSVLLVQNGLAFVASSFALFTLRFLLLGRQMVPIIFHGIPG